MSREAVCVVQSRLKGRQRKAKGRHLSRDIALSSDLSKIWFGVQITTLSSRNRLSSTSFHPRPPDSSVTTPL
jgi:hypothetical protein